MLKQFLKGFTGTTYQVPRIDPMSFSLQTISHFENEVHEGHAFCVHHAEADFDKADVIGILFTTPNSTKHLHMLALVYAGSSSFYQIYEAPTLDPANYPTSFTTPINRNRNSSITSDVLSARAVPVVNQVALKTVPDVNPVTATGTVLHAEMIGSGKQGGGGGNLAAGKYILKRNTLYYFRLSGTAAGADNSVASIELTWAEHTALE